MRFYGHHGVTPAQQEAGAWLWVPLSDDVEATVDYATLAGPVTIPR